MPELKHILIDILPENEVHYLKENLGNETTTTIYISETLEEFPELLDAYPAEECIFIAEDKERLDAAIGRGMASLCYLAPEKSEQTKTHLSPDMYAEGMEEVDLDFLLRVYLRHHSMPWTILETARCIVREFSMDDLDDLFALYAGEGMTAYMEGLHTYEKEREIQQAYINNMYRFYGYGMWLICDRKTGKLIGRAGLEHIAHEGKLGEKVQLGYAIGVPYQHCGYATEVCQAIIDYAKTELELDSLVCLIDENNEKSIRLAQKLGFSQRDTIQIEGKNVKIFQRDSADFCVL